MKIATAHLKKHTQLIRLIAFILTLAPYFSIAQSNYDTSKIPFNCSCKIEMFDGQKIYSIAEKMPGYTEGEINLYNLIRNNLVANKSSGELQTRIYLSFVIDTTGSVTNKCLKNTYYPDKLTEMEQSALLALDKMKNWIPGEQSGKKVNVRIEMPIIIDLH